MKGGGVRQHLSCCIEPRGFERIPNCNQTQSNDQILDATMNKNNRNYNEPQSNAQNPNNRNSNANNNNNENQQQTKNNNLRFTKPNKIK
jgi:hypothetical protein